MESGGRSNRVRRPGELLPSALLSAVSESAFRGDVPVLHLFIWFPEALTALAVLPMRIRTPSEYQWKSCFISRDPEGEGQRRVA